MASYELDTFLKGVRVSLDENRDASALVDAADADTLTLDELIESKVVDAATMLVKAAPLNMISDWTSSEVTPTFNNDLSGYAYLPESCIRLLEVSCKEWERPVRNFIDPSDPLYNMQYGRWGGLKGSIERPVVCLFEEGTEEQGANRLEFWRCRTASATLTVKYMREPYVSDDMVHVIPARLYRPIVYQTAALVAQVLGGVSAAQSLGKVSADLIGLQSQAQAQ